MEEVKSEAPIPQSTAVPQPAIEPIVAAPQLPETEKIDIEYFMKVELRVARIESVEALPKSKKLLKLQLDVGPAGKRQILAGISQFYTPEALIGRHIVIVANLKPATLMGVQSEGMLLAASTAEVSQLVILDPGQTMPPGSIVR